MVKLILNLPKKYAQYLGKHLEKEHPKTKGKIDFSSIPRSSMDFPLTKRSYKGGKK
jgi:hypothetical protein